MKPISPFPAMRRPAGQAGSPQHFAHPQLRLAAGDADLLRRQRLFRRDLRKLVNSEKRVSQTADELEALALGLLREIDFMSTDGESNRCFKLELLKFLRESVPTPRLMHALFVVELKRAEVRIEPRFWLHPTSHVEEQRLPQLSYGGSQVAGKNPPLSIPRECSAAAVQAVELAAQAIAEGTLEKWSVEACKEVIAMLVITSVHGTPLGRNTVMHPADNLFFIEGVGLSVWRALGEHLRHREESVHEVYWGSCMPAQVLMHLRGHLQSAELAPAAPTPVPEINLVEGPEPPGFIRIVREPIPPSTEKYDQESLRTYERLRKAMPVARMPGREALAEHFAQMEAEFPWATQAVEHLRRHLTTASLLGVEELMVPPTLLVGPPGSGKSRFVRRLAERLGLPYMPLALGGTSDSKLLAGTARGWATADASPILRLMVQSRSASPLVLLDEVDKIGRHYNGGSIDAQLLGLLEPETASRWRDGYLLVNCDLSRVNFWATANSLASISRPLLSRMQPLYIPAPGREHLPSIAAGLTREMERQWKLPPGTLPDPPAAICDAGADNVRALRTIVQRYLADWAREHREPQRMH
ncbi:AAA family ATPase [Caenimonas sedimenti]|uniref:AAA family ATPase n=1 Tax=Caenimonas sedimenti TaxID=2596921 RepID=A0A562ZCQ8_9BURK|nr:AAA family ATPase [Caenimonas sedimenti]TWO63122.1 AAA family ATPase [Caenimonas sedimenti]